MTAKMDERSDHELITASAAGDRPAFDELMRRHQAAVYRLARGLTRSAAAAEDALQETFLSALQHAGSYRGQGSVKGWLMAIAHRAALRGFRRRVGEPRRFETLPLEELGLAAGWGAPLVEPHASALDHERTRRAELHAALETLGGDDQEVITLRDLEELSTEETAAILGISAGAVKVRLHRARLRLMAAVRGSNDLQAATGAGHVA